MYNVYRGFHALIMRIGFVGTIMLNAFLVFTFWSFLDVGKAFATPMIQANPTALNFGNVNVNSESSKSVTLSNVGTEDLIIDQILISGTDESQFALQNDGCSGQTIVPNGSCLVSIAFTPLSRGSKSAQMIVPSNDPDLPSLAVPLSGNGVGIPDITVDPESFDFGSVAINTESAPKTFTISNIGTGELTIGNIVVVGQNAPAFIKENDQCTGQTLDFEEICTVDIVFFPTATGDQSANLRIPSNDPVNSIVDVLLKGIGERSCGGVLIYGQFSTLTFVLLGILPLFILWRMRRSYEYFSA